MGFWKVFDRTPKVHERKDKENYDPSSPLSFLFYKDKCRREPLNRKKKKQHWRQGNIVSKSRSRDNFKTWSMKRQRPLPPTPRTGFITTGDRWSIVLVRGWRRGRFSTVNQTEAYSGYQVFPVSVKTNS